MCFTLHQRIRVGSVDDNLRHADLEPGELGLLIGSNKRADGGMRHLCGELAFGQGEPAIDNDNLLHLAAFLPPRMHIPITFSPTMMRVIAL
jgi:hypothetical protein